MSSIFESYTRDEFRGIGRIKFRDGRNYGANFQIYLFNSGSLIGSAWINEIDLELNDELNRNEPFELNGVAGNDLKISAERCAIYSIVSGSTNELQIPLITVRFIVSSLEAYSDEKLKELGEKKADLCFEFGILNYHSATGFTLNTHLGDIHATRTLSEEQVPIFQKSSIPFISAVFTVKVSGQKFSDPLRKGVYNEVERVLQLSSFALTTEQRWSFCKVYVDEFAGSNFLYSECFNRQPKLPDSHNNVDNSRLAEFLTKSYNNYSDELNTKYNFAVVLQWYLDSFSLRNDVFRFISATTALESILDTYSTESGQILTTDQFKDLKNTLATTIRNKLGEQVQQEDIDLIVNRLADINRRSYMKKAESLLKSLGIFNKETKVKLKEIIMVRNSITHSGSFDSENSNDKKVVDTYLNLITLLTRVFLKILPADDTFLKEFDKKEWYLLE
jgi:hypothetical protein